uniref:Ig-like domain-containing protein n=1 Tax=Cyprinodon variegatus TaxID=28743 RepID=A0A3Q2DG94_CYPVA
MLGTLCSLITALTCNGVTVVTQKPSVLTVRKGETATMDCNLGTVTNSEARWYRQIPGGVPLYMLRIYHGWSSPRYDTGFPSSTTDYRLIINNIEEGDSAVYYCQTLDDSQKVEKIRFFSESWSQQVSVPVWMSLEWLPVCQKIDFKLCYYFNSDFMFLLLFCFVHVKAVLKFLHCELYYKSKQPFPIKNMSRENKEILFCLVFYYKTCL